MKLNKLFIVGLSSIILSVTASAENPEIAKDKVKPKCAKKSFTELDTDQDGKISEAEFTAPAKNKEKAKKRFARKDKDQDSFLSKEELKAKGKGKGKKGPKKRKGPKKEEDPVQFL